MAAPEQQRHPEPTAPANNWFGRQEKSIVIKDHKEESAVATKAINARPVESVVSFATPDPIEQVQPQASAGAQSQPHQPQIQIPDPRPDECTPDWEASLSPGHVPLVQSVRVKTAGALGPLEERKGAMRRAQASAGDPASPLKVAQVESAVIATPKAAGTTASSVTVPPETPGTPASPSASPVRVPPETPADAAAAEAGRSSGAAGAAGAAGAELQHFLAEACLGKYYDQLAEMGCTDLQGLREDFENKDLQEIGMHEPAIRKLRRLLQEEQARRAGWFSSSLMSSEVSLQPAVSPMVSPSGSGAAAAAALQPGAKFVGDPSALILGSRALATMGIQDMLGLDNHDRAMIFEHAEWAIEREIMHNTAVPVSDRQKQQYNMIVKGDDFRTPKHPNKCEGKLLDELCRHPYAKKAQLKRHHILALRMYTADIFPLINTPFRQDVTRHPLPATTMFIDEACKKLRAIEAEDDHSPLEERVYWRGMKNVKIPEEFMEQGGAEKACMSTTLDRSLAIRYSKSESPLVFEVKASDYMSRGAGLKWLSVFPNEEEYLYPPGTCLTPKGKREEEMELKSAGGEHRAVPVTIVTVEPRLPT